MNGTANNSTLRCLRCFQLLNYGSTRHASLQSVRPADFRTFLMNKLNTRKHGVKSVIILKVVDIFDLEGSFVKDFKVRCWRAGPSYVKHIRAHALIYVFCM